MPQYNVNTLSQRGRIQEPLPVLLDRLTVGVYCRSGKMSNNGISQKKRGRCREANVKFLVIVGMPIEERRAIFFLRQTRLT